MKSFCFIFFLGLASTLWERTQAQTIPSDLVISRDPKPELLKTERGPFTLASLSVGATQQVFASPPCMAGNFYAAFQLYYDLGNTQTQVSWTADLSISLLYNTTVLWTKPLSVRMTDQTFLSTVFHSVAISCDPNYKIRVDAKTVTGTPPQSNIYLKFLLYKVNDGTFSPSTQLTLNCPQAGPTPTFSWQYAGAGVVAYDVEWVFVADHEGYSCAQSSGAFNFKQPVRVTIAGSSFPIPTYYPTGKLYFRARAVGYNPSFPEHRINGAWFYCPCPGLVVNNPEADMNWQRQTFFSEEGKNKKVVTYFDGSLRARQSQTNLSTSGDTTVVGEVLYDFEGRKAVDILSVPSLSTNLQYKAAFNTFQSTESAITANTSASRKKFHYDNTALNNSTVSESSGAGLYYSSNNSLNAYRKAYIPDADGYVYSQTEYLNDGTGRISRQSGVGKEFRIDGAGHHTKYFYGNAAQSELSRLFGSNVGNANHYKKNMVVDPNGQASVSYLDQEGRVIATALAGTPPLNVQPLDSYTGLSSTPVVVDLSSKNAYIDGKNVIVQKVLNTVANTTYSFDYSFSGLAATLSQIGCVDCSYDLKITITDPEGRLININSPVAIPGNEAPNGSSYERHGVTIHNCVTPETGVDIQFSVNFVLPGDYTITKTLIPAELSFDQAKARLLQSSEIQTLIQDIQNSYTVDAANCDVCTSCPEGEAAITSAMTEIADLDCQNIYQRIVQSFLDLHPNNPDYYPTETEIQGHANYCQYTLCSGGKSSDLFEKQLARVATWSEAVSKGYNTLASLSTNPYPDPMFRSGGQGASYTTLFQNKLNDQFVGTVGYDVTGNGTQDGTHNYYGTILQVTDPTNGAYFIDQNGNGTNSNLSGKHILYYDLMGRRNANQISQAEYTAELDRQRWTLFRAFYLETKRKTKLLIPAFYNCPEAKRRLEEPGDLPKTEGEIREFGDVQGVTAPVSTEELESLLGALTFDCQNGDLSESDRLAIVNHLRNYFNSKPVSLVRYILASDVGTNSYLNAIQTILNNHGCANILTLAQEDPLNCLSDTTITYKNKFIQQGGGGGAQFMLAQSSSEGGALKRVKENDPALSEVRKQSEKHLADLFAESEERRRTRNELRRGKEKTEKNQLSPDSQSMMLLSSLPSQAEYDALIALYNATGGPSWTNKTGWSTANPNTIQDVSNWYGVDTDASGHVITINLYFNNLSGQIPSAIGDLVYLEYLDLSYGSISGTIPSAIGNLVNLRTLVLSNSSLSGAIPSSMAALTNLRRLDLFRNQLTGGVPSWLGQLTTLEELNLGINPLGGAIPTSLGNMTSLQDMILYSCQLTGSIPTQLGNLANLELLYLQSNQLTGQIPASLGNLTKASTISLGSNQLSGGIPPELGNCESLLGLILGPNPLGGAIPPELGNLPILNTLSLESCQLTGNIPPALGNLKKLVHLGLSLNQLTGVLPRELGDLPVIFNLSVSSNQLSGEVPAEFGNFSKLAALTLDVNNFSGPIPSSLSKLTKLQIVRLNNNQFRGDISKPLLGSAPLLGQVWIQNNQFTIDDFLDLKASIPSASFLYSPQAPIPAVTTLEAVAGNSRTLSTMIDRNLTPPAKYQWFEYINGVNYAKNPESDTSHTWIIYDIIPADSARKFFVKIRHDNLPGMILSSPFISIHVLPNTNKTVTFCLDYDSAALPNWAEVIQRCMQNAVDEKNLLIAYATDKLLDERAGGFYLQQRSNCLANLTESFTYSYAPKEHHYTLYYYDQAGNVVQTVPPEGVDVVGAVHDYVTRYQYNSFDQLIWQRTPDAGESRFWYNDKTQLRLSRNAQQVIDATYSYTKYDEQGRTTEVGELNTASDIQTLLPLLEDVTFPVSPAYNLTDITRTFYDLPNVAIQAEFPQQFLRSRVAWVEVYEKNATGVIATYYSYDVHGNVKSLLQQIPGLQNKRTDYVYDLVSGNVNYVMYQYGAPDQFIHRYKYDADNRITDVATSSDGYLWDTEATYKYYLHGPLARMELGQYRVQGLDYYYTLQGWLKGVNMPFASDPGRDGNTGVNLRAGRDVFSYSLGYFENDYAPSNAAVVLSDIRDNLWPRYKGAMGSTNTGLYNGNISWMVTDLKKIGQQKGARVKGMQGMLYKYDQLHRIVQSRGLTSYSASTGFGTPTSAYDETFTYDDNGNILTLQRKNDGGTLADNFTYSYYPHTNKLRYHIPILRDTTYAGAIASNNKVYRRITVQGTSFAPSGQNVLIKAIENIDIDQGFTVQSGATFRAYVLTNEEGAYNYDAIGNLIWDQDKGVRISWTPYGKVRGVTKGDGTVVSFRYDGAGNRIEKKMVKAGNTTITRYVRDAGGNVMAVYNDAVLLEQSIYGSTRLGLYHDGAADAQRTLGFKTYELSNHLGNVLSVVTDNIRMTPDSTWATVVSAGDYYAFGSGMPARDFADGVYRYGFNGKERDNKVEWGNTSYDYGFRIYNPAIGRFLSSDPLTSEYAALTPYQFASNCPILGIDRDGLEFEPYWASTIPAKQRAYESQLRKEDPENAEKIIRQHNLNAMFVVGSSVYAGAIVLQLPTAGSVLTGLFYRGAITAYANPEIIVGGTGLIASLFDPNPYSDYPGTFDDLARGAKLLFKSGKAERFVFNTNRLNFFHGRGTGTAENVKKSVQRAKDFIKLGITDDVAGTEKILKYMDQAVDLAPEGQAVKNSASGMYEVWKVVQVTEGNVKKGFIKFGFSYADEAMKTTPEVTTAIPMPSEAIK